MDSLDDYLSGWLDLYLESKQRLLVISAVKGWSEPRLGTIEAWLRFRYHLEMSKLLASNLVDSGIIGAMCSALREPVKSGVRTFLREEVLFVTSGMPGHRSEALPRQRSTSRRSAPGWRGPVQATLGMESAQLDSIVARIRAPCPPHAHGKPSAEGRFRTPDYEAHVIGRIRRLPAELAALERRVLDSTQEISRRHANELLQNMDEVPGRTIEAMIRTLVVSPIPTSMP